jgi:hypothetical protein
MPTTEIVRRATRVRDSDEARKHLGQYFTGVPLARLLAALAGADEARSIIDPMAGSGDMLVACREMGAGTAEYCAVEIDPDAYAQCAGRAPFATMALGSAFDPGRNSVALARQWDLVITNPPYVRYQRLSSRQTTGIRLPSSDDVRQGLLSSIGLIPGLDDEDRAVLSKLASSYSGLADLALPSIILCSALCSIGGRMALVVPESWLSRDYAAAAQYALLRFFRIRFVIEDAHAAWFEDAQVKTTLLVAERVRRRSGASDPDPRPILRVRIPGWAKGPRGVVDGLFPGRADPERAFATAAGRMLAGDGPEAGLDATLVQPATLAGNLLRNSSSKVWVRELEGGVATGEDKASFAIPDAVEKWLSRFGAGAGLTTLEGVRAHVGQGLRTGANAFFYTDLVRSGEDAIVVRGSSLLGGTEVPVPPQLALPVLRKQSELPDGYVIRSQYLPGRVLAIRGYATERDIRTGGPLVASAYLPLPSAVAGLVRAAEAADFGDADGSPKRIGELTAVAPNVRTGDKAKGIPPRFWYMLPEFAPRHIPDLVVPRIVGGPAKAYLNESRKAVVDANFSTVWLDHSAPDRFALLALLNSSWCAAILELTASVMGGGALKVEASHLRRMPIPSMLPRQWASLASLGRRLASTREPGAVLADIDRAVAEVASGGKARARDVKDLTLMTADARERRARHKKSTPAALTKTDYAP